MLKKILVAIDSSEVSNLIFDEALSLAQAVGARLRVLQVVPLDEETDQDVALYFDLDAYPSNLGDDAAYVERRFGAYIAKAMRSGVKTEFFQYLGNPGEVICDFAKTWTNDLIVVGRRGRSGLSEKLLGSVSNYVVHHAPCSVHVVHCPVHAPSKGLHSQTAKATT